MTGHSAEVVDSEICVVGGGPAGLSAALAARQAGAQVVLLDLFDRPGGQYFMQPPHPVSGLAAGQVAQGRALIEKARESGVVIRSRVEVFGADGATTLLARQGERALVVRAKALVLATGAHERSSPFPGWTLPGVMNPGAAQRLIKMHGITPGKRVVLAGCGPFLLVVAAQLHHAGCEVVRVVEASPSPLRLAATLLRFPSRWAEAAGLLRAVAPLWSRFRFGRVVAEAMGEGHVSRVRFAFLDKEGRLGADDTETIDDIDALLVGYGFRPSVEIAALLGCSLRHDWNAGGHHVVIDEASGATSVSGVFAAGEITGVAGARPALAGGACAGAAAARFVGRPAGYPPRSYADRADRFAKALRRAFRVPYAALGQLPDAETLLCRCEEVRATDVAAALQDGGCDAHGVKMWTRAGMGLCQGRICGFGLSVYAAQRVGLDPASFGANAPRFPARPAPLEVLAEATAAVALPQADLADPPHSGLSKSASR